MIMNWTREQNIFFQIVNIQGVRGLYGYFKKLNHMFSAPVTVFQILGKL